ncbi:hypothetical protein MKZ38_001295 [Zalerion maritima]|uniref:Uncharacterized protein n=1 Tax=Zalerion maritima TaxID=339359 RepID=A0AAD5RQH8_9PEZI|nr:hypothetical protein MKZ38_001295 [Zalerion maritima]
MDTRREQRPGCIGMLSDPGFGEHGVESNVAPGALLRFLIVQTRSGQDGQINPSDFENWRRATHKGDLPPLPSSVSSHKTSGKSLVAGGGPELARISSARETSSAAPATEGGSLKMTKSGPHDIQNATLALMSTGTLLTCKETGLWRTLPRILFLPTPSGPRHRLQASSPARHNTIPASPGASGASRDAVNVKLSGGRRDLSRSRSKGTKSEDNLDQKHEMEL